MRALVLVPGRRGRCPSGVYDHRGRVALGRSGRSALGARSTPSGRRLRSAPGAWCTPRRSPPTGFITGNPVGMNEDWPARPAAYLFYARRKQRSSGCSGKSPPATRDRDLPPAPADRARTRCRWRQGRRPGTARAACPAGRWPGESGAAHGDRAAGAYPVRPRGRRRAGVPSLHRRCRCARRLQRHRRRRAERRAGSARPRSGADSGPGAAPTRAARGVAALPFAPPFAGWAESIPHPAIADATKAKQELGWRPRYTSLEALHDTLKTA
jgi:hypothetical protein